MVLLWLITTVAKWTMLYKFDIVIVGCFIDLHLFRVGIDSGSGFFAWRYQALNQYWLVIDEAHWHLAEVSSTNTDLDIAHYKVVKIYAFENAGGHLVI